MAGWGRFFGKKPVTSTNLLRIQKVDAQIEKLKYELAVFTKDMADYVKLHWHSIHSPACKRYVLMLKKMIDSKYTELDVLYSAKATLSVQCTLDIASSVGSPNKTLDGLMDLSDDFRGLSMTHTPSADDDDKFDSILAEFGPCNGDADVDLGLPTLQELPAPPVYVSPTRPPAPTVSTRTVQSPVKVTPNELFHG